MRLQTKDSLQLRDLYRAGTRLATNAKANAWGTLGGVCGYIASRVLFHVFASPLLTAGEFPIVGYVLAVAVYTVVSKSYSATSQCLGFAELMFAENKITLTEYNAMRKNCLKRAGLIGSLR